MLQLTNFLPMLVTPFDLILTPPQYVGKLGEVCSDAPRFLIFSMIQIELSKIGWCVCLTAFGQIYNHYVRATLSKQFCCVF